MIFSGDYVVGVDFHGDKYVNSYRSKMPLSELFFFQKIHSFVQLHVCYFHKILDHDFANFFSSCFFNIMEILAFKELLKTS
jgi:hypothetical protein